MIKTPACPPPLACPPSLTNSEWQYRIVDQPLTRPYFGGTVDFNSIHLHLVEFSVLGYIPLYVNRTMTGPLVLPPANMAGPKDTVQCLPMFITRIAAYFPLSGLYVWHCHILSHEDHDMMRPMWVLPHRPLVSISVTPMIVMNPNAMCLIEYSFQWKNKQSPCDGKRVPYPIASLYMPTGFELAMGSGFGFELVANQDPLHTHSSPLLIRLTTVSEVGDDHYQLFVFEVVIQVASLSSNSTTCPTLTPIMPVVLAKRPSGDWSYDTTDHSSTSMIEGLEHHY